jgi:hypothetical protein
MITFETRDNILMDTTGDNAVDHIGRRIILSGDRGATRYGVIASGNAKGCLVRVDYVGESAKPGIARVKIMFSRDDSRADNAVTFGKDGYAMGRTTSNTMGVQAAGQCDCGSFHCSH